MNSLYSLINIRPDKKEMVCMVGGGGKTSAMFRLAAELADRGGNILVTTTTAIYHPGEEQCDRVLISDREAMDLFDNRSGITVLGRSLSSEGKLLGVAPGFLDAVFLEGIFDCIIVEGDGSKGRPIKAPAGYEPVIPSRTTRLLGLIGLDSIGKRVCAEHVHRPELFCRITGCLMGDIIDAETISRLVTHEEGLFKTAPASSEKYLVLNKADGEKERKAAGDIVNKLLACNHRLDGIVTASLKKASFEDAQKRVSGIILASGLARRMGTNKLLLPIGGIPAIERVIAAASSSGLNEVILVCSSAEVASLGHKYGIRVVHNAAPELGQSSSIRLGVESSSSNAAGFMFLVGDQPYVSEAIINSLLDNFASKACSAVIPLYNGNRGNPVIFAASQREKLMGLTGDEGGRVLLAGLTESTIAVGFDDEKPGFDFDTREEYEALLLQED